MQEFYKVTHRDGLYIIDNEENPVLLVERGKEYVFDLDAKGHPFWIKTEMVSGTEAVYEDGVENNGTEVGTITFIVPQNAPETLYYACQFHDTMQGEIQVLTEEEAKVRRLVNQYLDLEIPIT